MLDIQQLRLAFVAATQGLADNLGQLTKANTARFDGHTLTELSANVLLGTVANAGTLGQLTYQSLVDAYTGDTSDLSDIEAQLAAFIARRDNPHLITQEQLDLGNLVNQGFATLAETDLGVTDKYISPAMVKHAVDQAIETLVGTAPETMDTLQEIAAILQNDPDVLNKIVVDLSGLITIADSQALMDSRLVEAKSYTDTTFLSMAVAAANHSDINVGTLADWLSQLADQYSPISIDPNAADFEGLLSGDSQLGWFGLVPAADFINVIGLVSQLGSTDGINTNQTTPWMKFAHQGRVLYIPQKPIQYNNIWRDFYRLGLVYGSRRVVIQDREYIVRLIKGSDNDPFVSVGGEWNDLMYRVSDYNSGLSPEEKWANFTVVDLAIANNVYGQGNWCQETDASGYGLVRGPNNVGAYSTHAKGGSRSNYRGWRPVLELVPKGDEVLSTSLHLTQFYGGRTTGLIVGNWSYGYGNYGGYNFGTIVNDMIGTHNLQIALLYNNHNTREIHLAVYGDQTTTLVLKTINVGSWEIDLSEVQPVYNSEQDLTYWVTMRPEWASHADHFNLNNYLELFGQVL